MITFGWCSTNGDNPHLQVSETVYKLKYSLVNLKKKEDFEHIPYDFSRGYYSKEHVNFVYKKDVTKPNNYIFLYAQDMTESPTNNQNYKFRKALTPERIDFLVWDLSQYADQDRAYFYMEWDERLAKKMISSSSESIRSILPSVLKKSFGETRFDYCSKVFTASF
jgi:hypothetical protein